MEKVYKLKGKFLGWDEGDSKEGVHLESDELTGAPKHIQELLKTTGMESCKAVNRR